MKQFENIEQPPLYKIQQGKKIQYAYDDHQLEDILALLPETPKPTLQLYKGLGEMNPEQLWDTTMNPETSTLLRVSLEDAMDVDGTFRMLMGDQVEPRCQFIEENARCVQNLDV